MPSCLPGSVDDVHGRRTRGSQAAKNDHEINTGQQLATHLTTYTPANLVLVTVSL